jgi:hypothetical protein
MFSVHIFGIFLIFALSLETQNGVAFIGSNSKSAAEKTKGDANLVGTLLQKVTGS